MNNTQLRKIRNVLPFLLEKSEFEFTFFKSEQGSDSFREPAGYTIRTGFRLQNITFPRMNHFPIGMCRMRFYRNRRKRRVNRNPVPISYPRSSRSFSISADESVTPFPIFVRSWFQLRMSYFGSPPFQDTMLTSFFQPLLDSESTPILLRYSAGILGNSITDESRTVF